MITDNWRTSTRPARAWQEPDSETLFRDSGGHHCVISSRPVSVAFHIRSTGGFTQELDDNVQPHIRR